MQTNLQISEEHLRATFSGLIVLIKSYRALEKFIAAMDEDCFCNGITVVFEMAKWITLAAMMQVLKKL